jgi:hypothetical protein
VKLLAIISLLVAVDELPDVPVPVVVLEPVGMTLMARSSWS